MTLKSNGMVNETSLRFLERAIVVVVTLVLGTTLLMLTLTGLNKFKQAELAAKSELTKHEIRSLNDTIEKGKHLKFSSSDKKQLSAVQLAMDRLADVNKCQIQELTSTNDTVQFATRYKKGIDEKGWKQLPVSGTIVGSISDVIAFNRDLAMITIPIEITAIDIAPIASIPGKPSRVSAKISFQILKQGGSR
jgi:Tfp pilus assembly protein PilO